MPLESQIGSNQVERDGDEKSPSPLSTATSRRGVYRRASGLLTAMIAGVLAIPAVAYILTPLLKGRDKSGGFTTLARFADLKPGVPQAFPVIEARQDAWVRYPPEPVGTVWLIRQEDSSDTPVVALSAECPHLACAITLSPNGREFFCPCHTSAFSLTGERLNKIPPRGMDPLEVEPFDPSDPEAEVRIRFQRFRTMTEERISLA